MRLQKAPELVDTRSLRATRADFSSIFVTKRGKTRSTPNVAVGLPRARGDTDTAEWIYGSLRVSEGFNDRDFVGR